jgi:aminocarboxymuconate-semialdehyde decarboxylase
LIVDAHCHVIIGEMMTSAVPEHWRPAISVEDGRQIVTFRGRVLRSIVAEFTDIEVMAGQAAVGGIDHLLLSPWIMLVPTEAGLAEAIRICRVQNEGLSQAAAGGRVSALGAVPLQDAAAAATELEHLMRLPGLRGAEIPASVQGCYLGDDRFLPFWEAAEATGALIFVHPTTRGFGLPALSDYYLWNSAGNPMETAVTAAHLAAAGVPAAAHPARSRRWRPARDSRQAAAGVRRPARGQGPLGGRPGRRAAPVLLRHRHPRPGAAGRSRRLRRR